MVRDTHGDRAQLVLITAIVIAVILLGMTLVFNSVLYTQTSASGDKVQSVDDKRFTHLEIHQSIGDLTHIVNLVANESFNDTLEAERSTFERIIKNTTATAQPIAIANLNVTKADTGHAAVGPMTDDYLIASDDPFIVGHARLELYVSSLEDGNVTVNVTESGSPTETVIFDEDDGAVVTNTGCTITPAEEQGAVTIDLRTGWVDAPTEGCDLSYVARNETYESIEIMIDDGVSGSVELIVRTDDPDSLDTSVPGLSEVAWSVHVSYDRIGTDAVAIGIEDEIHPYGDGT